jgi:hypothetical protein
MQMRARSTGVTDALRMDPPPEVTLYEMVE